MTRLAFMVIMLTSTLTGVLLAREVKSQNVSETKVSLDMNKAELREIFQQLEKQSGFRFYYDQEIGSIKGVTLKENTTLDVILKKLANLKHLRFTQENSLIAVTKSPLPPPLPPPGSIKGRVVEFETSEPLPGATIRIVELNKGTASDEKGFYHLGNIPPGKYTLEVSFIGYEVYWQVGTEINEGKELTLDVKLKASNNLNEVVVKSRKIRTKASVSYSNEKDLVLEMKNAVGVVSGISNEMISKTADRNAAEVVKRISGVTVVDDRFIVVRGMNERYNLTYLNGNVAPSTELYDKAFAYDLLPSSIIDKILVYKSPVADLVADYAGAAIKVYTKDAVPVRHIDVGLQFGYRPGSTIATVNSYTGGKFDFLGFDDGTRKLPNIPPGYFQTAQPNQQTLVNSFSPTLDYGHKQSPPDMQVYFNYFDSFKLWGHAHLYNLSSINYTYETRFYDVHRQTGNTGRYGADTSVNIGAGLDVGDGNKITQNQQTTEIGKVNILENLTLKLDNHNTLKFKNFFVNEGRNLTSVSDTRPNYSAVLDSTSGYHRSRDILLSFQQRLLYSGNLGGSHDLGPKNRSTLDWNLGYTYDLQNVPDQRLSQFASALDGTGYGGRGQYVAVGVADPFLGMISRVFVKNSENLYNFSTDYTFRLNENFSFKAGTYNLFKLRNVDRRIFRVNRGGFGLGTPADLNYSGDNEPGFYYGFGLSDPNLLNYTYADLAKIWNPNNFPSNGSGLQIYDATALSDSYVASEENHSFYGMGDWKGADNTLTINAGLRIEYDRQKVSGAGIYTGIPYAIPVDHPKTSVLPSVNISYRPDSAYVIRAGFGRSLNRPEFREITPYDDFDYQNNEMIRGNPSVVTATIDNYDLRAEFYPRNSLQNETFNIGVFYKKLTDPIEKLRVDQSSSTIVGNSQTQITFGNAASARVYGIETELKKNLAFMGGGLFRNLSIVINGALIKSTTVQKDIGIALHQDSVPTTGSGRPLQGQSPYVLNTGLFYENPGWGTKIGFTYNVSGPRIYAKSIVNPNLKSQKTDTLERLVTRPDLLELPRHLLDFSVTQRIIRSLQVKASVQNLLNQSFRIVEDQNYNQKYDPEKPVKGALGQTYYTGDNIFTEYNPGRYFIIQFTYAF